jgi:hypothetical protein
MPLFLDVHDTLPARLRANDVANARAADLEVQDRYRVRYIKQWFAPRSGRIFCLVEAPSAEAANTVHREAHGHVVDQIHEVWEARASTETESPQDASW